MTGIYITEAPQGVPATGVAALKTPDLRVVAFLPPANDKTVTGVATTVLRALGVDPLVGSKARHSSDVTHLAPIWLTAHRTETLYAISPQHSHPNSLASLVRICSASPADLVLAVDHGYLPQFAQDMAYAMPTIIEWPDTSALQHPEEEAFIGWDPEHRDLLPTDDYLTFYAQCERVIPPETFKSVHDLYVESLNRTLQWIETVGAANIDIENVKQAMGVLTAEQTNISEVIVSLRAAQAAFHRKGWYLKYEDSAILYGVLRFPPVEPTLSQWRRLRAYRDPHPSASVALYLCGLTVEEINALTVAELAYWHNNGGTIRATHIHPEAAPYIRAHLFNTLADDPNPDRLALGKIKANGHTNIRVQNHIRNAGSRLGTNIGDAVTLTKVSHLNRHVGPKTFALVRLA